MINGHWRKSTKSDEQETWRPRRYGSEPGEAVDKMQTMWTSLPKLGHRKRKKVAMTVKMQSLDKSKYDPEKGDTRDGAVSSITSTVWRTALIGEAS